MIIEKRKIHNEVILSPPADYVEDQGQENGKNDAGHDREKNMKPLSLKTNVPRKFSEKGDMRSQEDKCSK
jgi:hypothetical protein